MDKVDTYTIAKALMLQNFFKFFLYPKAIYALQKDSANEISTLAQKSVSTSDSAVSIQIVQTISQIELLDNQ